MTERSFRRAIAWSHLGQRWSTPEPFLVGEDSEREVRRGIEDKVSGKGQERAIRIGRSVERVRSEVEGDVTLVLWRRD